MFYLILIAIIFYLLYKEYKYSKNANALIHAYLYILEISYIRNKKQTIKNLNVYEEAIYNELTVDDYDQVYKTLTESWKIPYFKSPHNSFADGKRIIKELQKKLDYVVKEPGFKEIIKKAEYELDNPDIDY